jgi:hypothetical protein
MKAVLKYLAIKIKYNSDDGKVQCLLPFDTDIKGLKKQKPKKTKKNSKKKQKKGVKVNKTGKNEVKNSTEKKENTLSDKNSAKKTNKKQTEKVEKNNAESQSFFEKAVSKVKKLIDSIKKAAKKPEELYNKAVEFVSEIKAANEKYHFKVLVNETFLFFKRFFKALGLKKFRICGIIGLEDPSDTGTLIGAVSVVGAFVPIEKDISGDFQNKNLDIKAELKGRTCLFVLLYEIARYVLNKNVLPVFKDYSGIN